MGEWNTGLFGCFSNCSLCCFANALNPLTIGTVADAEFGAKQPILWALSLGGGPCLVGLVRTRVRQKHGIQGSFMSDCCASALCTPCVIHQLASQSTVTCDTILPNEQEMNRETD